MKEGKIRFNTVFVSDKIPSDAKILELKEWNKTFQKRGLTPEVQGNYTGNLSFRSKEGFVITASGLKNKENLADDCFVYVKAYAEQTNTFFVEGKTKPSSESIMHHLIYEKCEDINAVFHGHNDVIVTNASKLGLPVTEKEYESGTIELAKEVLNVLGNNKLIVLRNHGFVSLGTTMKEAGEQALVTLNRSKTANSATSRN
ncbi:class II aldolase/adducin family protein [Candidatus Bathyarchaeota archaeon]|nr:class II aldolase/adducin family protein [Candidatus Bathyarchaeota archaeon]